jgi:hypothetical protein
MAYIGEEAERKLEEYKRKQAEEANRLASQKELESFKLQYNPIEEIVGPDGKKTIAIRKEFQMGGPEEFITRERERFGLEKAAGLDQLRQEQAMREAQQRASMATRFGMKGGPSPLSRYSMKDALMARQGLLGQQAKMGAEFESNAEKMRNAVKEANLKTLMESVRGVNEFELEKWKKQKEVEASKNSAEAARISGGGGGK